MLLLGDELPGCARSSTASNNVYGRSTVETVLEGGWWEVDGVVGAGGASSACIMVVLCFVGWFGGWLTF